MGSSATYHALRACFTALLKAPPPVLAGQPADLETARQEYRAWHDRERAAALNLAAEVIGFGRELS